MARIQQKSSGRRVPVVRVRIDSREMRQAAAESLSKRGEVAQPWGQFSGKGAAASNKPSTQP